MAKCFFESGKLPWWKTPCTNGGKATHTVVVTGHAPIVVCDHHSLEMAYNKAQVEAANPGASLIISEL